MTDKIEDTVQEGKRVRLGFAGFSPLSTTNVANPWSSVDVDKMEFNPTGEGEFKKTVSACRFFYKHDAIAGTCVNKLVDIGITDINITRGTLSENELRVFTGIKDKLQEFAEDMALEYLLSGLVIPEVKFAVINKSDIAELGIKKYEHLIMPITMWLRDPSTIIINQSMFSDKPSFYLIIPDKLIYFITSGGTYEDGTEDKELFIFLETYYPEFVVRVQSGITKFLLDNDNIIRRRPMTDSPYPVPYLFSAIEHMKHKRNLRRMDYAIASRIIGAVQLIQLGSDEFPITEDDSDQFEDIRNQMYWRDSGGRDVERVFQLFANHTLKMSWVFPPTDALLNETKYKDINTDIIFALGMPRTLLSGEAEKSNTGSSEYVSLSPVKTMEAMRRKVIKVINYILAQIAKQNNFKSIPTATFEPLRLENFQAFTNALFQLYTAGNISRTSYDDALGFNFSDEAQQRKDDDELIKELQIESLTVVPKPTASQPDSGVNANTTQPADNASKPAPKPAPKSTSKPAA